MISPSGRAQVRVWSPWNLHGHRVFAHTSTNAAGKGVSRVGGEVTSGPCETRTASAPPSGGTRPSRRVSLPPRDIAHTRRALDSTSAILGWPRG